MPSIARFFRIRIRNAANTSDAVVITSVRGGTNPDISEVPRGDGQEFDPLSGQARAGTYTGLIADAIVSGTDRVITSQLEDADRRQQLVDRRTFVEWSDDGSTWTGGTHGGVLVAGYLTQLRLVSGAEYEYTVDDATRAEREYVAFTPQTILDAGVKRKETLAEFLTRWPNRGCVLGGPVRGGFLNQDDRGGWEMTVDSRAGPTAQHSDTYLKFNAGYAAPNFDRTTSPPAVATAANDQSRSLTSTLPYGHRDAVVTFADAESAPWHGLVVELVGVGFYQPALGVWFFDGALIKPTFNNLVKDNIRPGLFIRTASLGTAGVPSAGTKVRVRAFTAEASEISPIYWAGHPVDLLSTLWTEAGVAFSSASLTTVRNAIGAGWRVAFRITEPKPLRDFLERNIYGPFGIGVRSNDAGELEAFAARIPYAAAPTTEITSADVWTDEDSASPEVFSITQSSAINKVIVEHQRLIRTQDTGRTIEFFGFIPITFGQIESNSPDGFIVQPERFERENADVGAVGSKSVTFTVDGMIFWDGTQTSKVADWVNALAYEIFDRWGRGIITGEIAGLRGGSTDAVNLGDEVLNKHPYLPNHNKRLSDDPSVSGRAMQVVAQTWDARGYRLKLADSGPNAQPFATQPTLTIAASSDHPRSVAEVTVTNAATLNTAGAGLRLQMAVTTGGAPASTDYADVGAYGPGLIPTDPIPLPAAVAGRTIYARATATKPGSRPSTFSSVVNVTLSVLPPVTSLSVTPSGTDGSLATAAWTPGDATSELYVYLRLTADPATANVLRRILPPSSSRFVLEGLTPSGAYTATVIARDPVTGDFSAAVTAAFTAGATTLTLSAPLSVVGFCGSRDPITGAPQRDGIFGVGVFAVHVPGFIEVAVATETSVGAGTYGSFVTDGRLVPSVAGDWTIWSDVAPNDGLRRQLKARHVADGVNVSSYTSVITLLPWTPLALPSFHATPQGIISASGDGSWAAIADGPPNTQSWRYALSTSALPSDATAAAGTVVSGRTFALASASPLTFGQTIYITAIAYDGPSGTGAQVAVSTHMQYAFTSYTATKTLTYSASSSICTQSLNFDDGGGFPLPYFYDADNALIGVDGVSGDINQFLQLLAGIPNGTTGVTITSVSVVAYDNNPAFTGGMSFVLSRGGTSPASIASVGTTPGGGSQTLTASCSENTSGRSYTLNMLFQAGSSTANDLRYRSISITYTMGDPKQAT